ncbi:UDP-glucose dehydrogenase family protein [Helicobacter mesocricetorum]|uniref:UDP-glucose dehydrogenase family protein n=1 Tax=Helicobacter mesocricetorum TaxID=87012 RepID=UPI000CF1004D|nr:UDP-glucose/GDP-mannose dehydrogenase family protein [Helicobacter mesocricetorum]
MNITIIGTGYVGLVSGTCFSEMGNKVYCVDIQESKIQDLKSGKIPIYEPGLEDLVAKNYRHKNLFFTISLQEALRDCEIVFIAVGTPMGEDGSADLQYVLNAAREIGEIMHKPLIIVNKSTAPVGTAQKIKRVIYESLQKRGLEISFSVASNPEFLKEGDAVNDFLKPDRVVIGTEDKASEEILKELYAPFGRNYDKIITMDIQSAEMTKYAANAMLATKISFINEIANICEAVGANVNDVRRGIGSDKRIGYSFIYAGCGYGGSCFPKDIRALSKIALESGVNPRIINAVEQVNQEQRQVLAKKIIRYFGEDLIGKSFGIWGLSFKPETDDMREAASVVLINELVAKGARLKVYDPKAMEEAKSFYLKGLPNIIYMPSKYEALKDCDALVLVTEWKEFRSPDFDEIKALLKTPIIFDGRNQYNLKRLQKMGFIYYQIGVKEC